MGEAMGRRNIAHEGPVNGLSFSPDGRWLVSVGFDARVRVWDCKSGANTLVSFGREVRSAGMGGAGLAWAGNGKGGVVALPSGNEVAVLDVERGRVVGRLKTGMGRRGRVTGVAWGAEGEGVFAAGMDGVVRVWIGKDEGDDDEDGVEEEGEKKEEGRKRKREVMDGIFRDLMAPGVTFGF